MSSKNELLELNGYEYDFKRHIYFDKKNKKIFSDEVVEDNTTDWLNDKIQEKNNTGSWQIYFSCSCTKDLREQLIYEMERHNRR